MTVRLDGCRICSGPIPPERRSMCGSPACAKDAERRAESTKRHQRYWATRPDKRCSVCGTRIPTYKQKYCGPECARINQRQHYEANKERIKEQVELWRANNPVRVRAYARASYRRHKEAYAERAKRYRASLPPEKRQELNRKKKVSTRLWLRANPDKLAKHRERANLRRQENREEINAKARKHYRQNRHAILERDARERLDNPEKYRERYQRNRADPEWVQKERARNKRLQAKQRLAIKTLESLGIEL